MAIVEVVGGTTGQPAGGLPLRSGGGRAGRPGGVPPGLEHWFLWLEELDMSRMGLAVLGAELLLLHCFQMLLAKNNWLAMGASLPKGLAASPLGHSMRLLNLSSNCFARLPDTLLILRSLSLGSNCLHNLTSFTTSAQINPRTTLNGPQVT
ncbi:UNVERIFIED_CONTAM: hypothetical protein K2H54_068216 [Gekko kuhli]